jgi:nicotinamide mononucleotide adenylyltransferase
MPKYLVETVSMFRMRYVVEAEEPDYAADAVVMEEAEEFGQHHVAENIINVREVSDNEIPRLFLEDNTHLESWGPEKAFEYITKFNP